MTRPTRELLDHRYPALEFSSNVHVLNYGERWEAEGVVLELASSNHILGAAQVRVALEDGSTVGYSGDFSWPLDDVIQVDGLVVDATYGKPSRRRDYGQQRVQEEFCELAERTLRDGPLHLMADTGPVERALQLLMMEDALRDVPVVGSGRTQRTISVHRRYGYHLPDVLVEDGVEARRALRTGRYVRLWGLRSRMINDGMSPGTVIRLTKWGTGDEPVQRIADRSYTVGFSNHADFDETIAYVRATGASVVVTDGLRGRDGDRAKYLAEAVQAELRGVKAYPSTNFASREWGA